MLVDERVGGDARGDGHAERGADAAAVGVAAPDAADEQHAEPDQADAGGLARARSRRRAPSRRRAARARAPGRGRSGRRPRRPRGGTPSRAPRSTTSWSIDVTAMNGQTPESASNRQIASGAKSDDRRDERDRRRRLGVALAAEDQVPERVEECRAEREGEGVERHRGDPTDLGSGRMQAARALVFDFNGTLSHDEPVLYAIYAELFAEHGRPLTEDDYFGTLAGNTEEAIIGGWLGVDGRRARRARRGAHRPVRPPAPTARRSPRRSARRCDTPPARVPVAVVSGAYRREIEPVLEAPGLAERVTAIVAADDVDARQARPRGLRPGARCARRRPGARRTSSRSRTPRRASPRRAPQACAASPCGARTRTNGSPRPTASSTRSTSSSSQSLVG